MAGASLSPSSRAIAARFDLPLALTGPGHGPRRDACEEQVNFGTNSINAYCVSDRAQVEACDYSNVKGQLDKIVMLKMCEHVGVKSIVSRCKSPVAEGNLSRFPSATGPSSEATR